MLYFIKLCNDIHTYYSKRGVDELTYIYTYIHIYINYNFIVHHASCCSNLQTYVTGSTTWGKSKRMIQCAYSVAVSNRHLAEHARVLVPCLDASVIAKLLVVQVQDEEEEELDPPPPAVSSSRGRDNNNTHGTRHAKGSGGGGGGAGEGVINGKHAAAAAAANQIEAQTRRHYLRKQKRRRSSPLEVARHAGGTLVEACIAVVYDAGDHAAVDALGEYLIERAIDDAVVVAAKANKKKKNK